MEQKNYLLLAQYRQGSNYDDQIGRRYHFPRKYFNQMTLPDAEFIYFEPKSGKGEYFGYGQIGEVTPDPKDSDQFYADILNYRPFSRAVSAVDSNGRPREMPPYYNPQNAVRKTNRDIFESICTEGGVELADLGVEEEISETDESITNPFDPSKIRVDREPMSVFQVLRKISLNPPEIILNPGFQRNLVWNLVRRSRLIESVLLGIPLPAFYFDGVDADHWLVIDGLQRLSTLYDYIVAKSFRLEGLEYLTDSAENKTFSELSRGMQRDLEETQVTLFIIRPETPPEVKFTIFYRINTGGLVLTAQEIRHALFQGQATELLKTLASGKEFDLATDDGVNDTRMDARECVLRYLAFKIHPYESYSKSDLNSFLSTAMKELNGMSKSDLTYLTESFREAMYRAHEIFGKYAFRKYTFGARRGPVNKALFESWANVLQSYPLDALRACKQKLIERVSEMFVSDPDYARSLSAGTGSVRSVLTRFGQAHKAVVEALK